MEVSIAEVTERLPELINAVESGEAVTITRDGVPVAQLTSPPVRREVRFGASRGQVEFLPGWDDPVDLDRFLAGDL